MIVRKHSEFVAVRSTDFVEVGDAHAFQHSTFANLVIEPAGKMALPISRVVNRQVGSEHVNQRLRLLRDEKFPTVVDFPKMVLTTLENAYCLPFGPPILPMSGQIITDFMIPWAPKYLPWFDHHNDNVYHASVDFDTAGPEYDLDTAFYMDHSVSGHYGHFVGDCLCRMYAWDVCRALFGDLKVIIANGAAPEFQAYLLNAAGVPDRDIIRLRYVARCKRLLLATQSLGVERYASPTSARLWSTIRDRSAVRDVSLPDRIYLSRSGIKDRKLLNETDVERVFERHGFTIIRLETLKPEKQIGLVSNALLVAGTSGSSMFNLAFQGRMRSAFILMWEERIQLSERLFSVGHNCDLWYHLGHRALFGTTEMGSWIVDLARLESDVADWLAQTGV
jgi:hypothetical protein